MTGNKVTDKAFRTSKWAWRSNGSEMYRGHKAEVRYCLGVFRCSVCGHLIRPNTNDTRRKEQLSKDKCKNRQCTEDNPSIEEYAGKCDAEIHMWSEERDGATFLVWEHTGFHNHPHPPGGRMTVAEEAAVDHQVIRRPEASVHQLRTGDAAPGSVPLGEINPTLSNPRSARYAISKSQSRLGIQPSTASKGGLSVLYDLAGVEKKLGAPFIVESSFSGPTYFTLQTPFMVDIIGESVADWIKQDVHSPDSGRHGFVTDGDHTFFSQGTLLVTCAFSTMLGQWIPVLYTWVHSLDIAHHCPHFRQLNAAILHSAGSDFQAKYLSAVRFPPLLACECILKVKQLDHRLLCSTNCCSPSRVCQHNGLPCSWLVNPLS